MQNPFDFDNPFDPYNLGLLPPEEGDGDGNGEGMADPRPPSPASGSNYVEPIHFGATWSTPDGAQGIGGDGVSVNVGEFVMRARGERMCTLTLGAQRLPGVGAFTIGMIYADIRIGVGAANYSFQMDWLNGQSISFPITTPCVITVNALQDGQFNGRISLAASFVPGTRGGSHLATWSTLVLLPAGAIPPVVIAVPRRAKSLFVPRRLLAGGVASDLIITPEYIGAGAIARYDHAVAADSAIWTTGVELPALCDGVRIVSAAGSPGLPPQRTSFISFGLDG